MQLCGRLVVRVGERRADGDLPGRQGRLAFAFLAVNRVRGVSRDELTEAVWSAGPPPAAAAALSALLSKIRKAVGEDAVEGRGGVRLVLPEPVWVDLEAAREAIHRAEGCVARRDWAAAWGPSRVALHVVRRGFLPGEDLPWVAEQRRELEEIEVRALECVAESSLELGGGELDSALRSGRDLVRLAPHRESGYRLLMRALAAEGNVAEALGVYEQLRVRLREDLGAAPSRTTLELHRSLLG